MEALVIRIGKLTKGLIVKKPKKKKRVYMDMDDSEHPSLVGDSFVHNNPSAEILSARL